MPHFILLDPSIVDYAGHYYEYAERVLRAAEEQGYTPVLAANRRCQVRSSATERVHPVFRHDFWYAQRRPGSLRRLTRWGQQIRALSFRAGLQLLLSPVGATWTNRYSLGACLRLLTSGPKLERLVVGLCLLPLLLGRMIRQLGRLAMALVPGGRALRNHAYGLVQRTVCGAQFRLEQVLARAEAGGRWWFARRMAHSFSEDCRELFRQLPLQTGDLVFVPTLGTPELAGLSEFFQQHADSRLASWHLVFRRNLYEGRDPDYSRQDERLRPLRNALRSFQRSLTGQRVCYYTDTDPLTDQYARLGVGTFQTLPIPVAREYRQDRSAQRPDSRLTAVYVGDARTEKGYQHLPRAVYDVWPDLVATGRLRFVFQSNYNTPGGEPPCVVARAQLESLPRHAVQLETAALSSQKYRETICSADLAMVLFDRDNYYARSSGTFTEAMVCGVPVIIPSGSWMATQVAGHIAHYHCQLASRSEWVITQRVADELRWFIHGQKALRSLEQGELWLAGSNPRCTWLDVPAGATHLLISFRQASGTAGQFTRIFAAQHDAAARLLVEQMAVCGGGPQYPGSWLAPLQSGAARLWLGLNGAYSRKPMAVEDLQITWLMAPVELPRSATALTYHDPGEIGGLLREFVEHAAHYRRTAREFAEQWGAFHDPNNLVRVLSAGGRTGSVPAPLGWEHFVSSPSTGAANTVGTRR